jgi:hypothetical protein
MSLVKLRKDREREGPTLKERAAAKYSKCASSREAGPLTACADSTTSSGKIGNESDDS